MSSPYSPKQFFRKISNAFLIKYFEQKNIEFGIDLHAVDEYDVNTIFKYFLKLNDDVRDVVVADFYSINSLASEGGIIALIDEAKEYGNIEFVEVITDVFGLHNKSMWAFLNNPEYWQGASLYFQADNITPTAWRKIKNLSKAKVPFIQLDIDLLSKAISDHFHFKEGRGRHCIIENYKRGDLEYYCAFPEDFAKSTVEWVEHKLIDLPHTMAFEIIMVYCKKNGTLDIHAKNNTKSIPVLQKLFAEYILKTPLPENGLVEKQVYNLDVLTEQNFEFKIPKEGGIFSVELIEARSSHKAKPSSYITVGECTTSNKNAIHEQLHQLNLILADRFISQVTLKVFFYPTMSKKTRNKLIKITHPDKCRLGYCGDDLVIRKMLIASGIEPHLIDEEQLEFKCM